MTKTQVDVGSGAVATSSKGRRSAVNGRFLRPGQDDAAIERLERSANGRFVKAKPKVRAERGAALDESEAEKKVRPVPDVGVYADREFRRVFPEIFDGLADKAKDGNTPQARLLAEWAKSGDAKAKRRGKKQKSLSEMLLDELKRRQDEREAAAAAAATASEQESSSSEGATSDGDAEEG